MESYINPYSYVGTILTKYDLINLVCEAILIPVNQLHRDRSDMAVDTRLIISYYLVNNGGISINQLPNELGSKVQRSTLNSQLLKFDERYKYNSYFRNRFDRVRKKLKKLNIDEKNFKIVRTAQ